MRNRIRQLLKAELSTNTPIVANKIANGVEVLIHDVIDPWYGVSSRSFNEAISGLTNEALTIRLNSPGGDVFDGRAIASAIRAYKGPTKVIVDGLAASVASTIAVAADSVEMSKGSFMMVHRAWTITLGNCSEMRQMADLLEKIDGQIAADYVAKSGCTQDQAMQWMDAETWFTADEAVAAKLADSVTSDAAVSNKFNLSAFDRTPQALLDRPDDTNERLNALRSRAAMRARLYEAA